MSSRLQGQSDFKRLPKAMPVFLTLTLALTVGWALADDVVLVPGASIKQAIGGRVRGQVQSESPVEVVVKLGASTTSVPTDQIASIRYDGQPATLQLAETRESAGRLAEAAELFKKAAGEDVKLLLPPRQRRGISSPFSRAATGAKSTGLQPLRDGFPRKLSLIRASVERLPQLLPGFRQAAYRQSSPGRSSWPSVLARWSCCNATPDFKTKLPSMLSSGSRAATAPTGAPATVRAQYQSML